MRIAFGDTDIFQINLEIIGTVEMAEADMYGLAAEIVGNLCDM